MEKSKRHVQIDSHIGNSTKQYKAVHKINEMFKYLLKLLQVNKWIAKNDEYLEVFQNDVSVNQIALVKVLMRKTFSTPF